MSDRIELYTFPTSHYCVCAERMLSFKGLHWKPIYVPYEDHTTLLRRTGQDYIPALIWNGKFVAWDEIPSFLERRRPTPSLFPSGTEAVARALDNWGHLVLEERVWRAVVTRVPPLLRSARERWAFEEMQSRARGPWHVLEARRTEFLRELVPYLGMVDRMVRDRTWILGEPSFADCGIFGALSPMWATKTPIPARFRSLARWAGRVRQFQG